LAGNHEIQSDDRIVYFTRNKREYIPPMILVKVVKLVVHIDRRLHMLVHLFPRSIVLENKQMKQPSKFEIHNSSIMGAELI